MNLYKERYLSCFPAGLLRGKRLGVYQHSSVSRDTLVEVLTSLGAEVIPLGRTDAFVPIDTEAISEEERLLAANWVKELKLDALLSTDGDGDRPLIADNDGTWLRGDIVGLLCARYLKANIVVTPISSNTAIELTEAFGSVLRTRIGSPYVIEGINQFMQDKHQGVIGFEANGGVLIGDDIQVNGHQLTQLPTRDALLPILSLLAATAEEKDFYQTEKIKAGDAAATEAKYPAKDAVLAKDFPGVTTNLAKIDAAVPNTGTPKAAAAPGPRPAAGPAASGIATIKPEDYRAQMEGFMPKEIIDPFAPERIDIAAAEKNVKQKQLTEFEKDIADRGLAGKGQEERIGKRETELGKQKDMNTNMSIIEAGLAMMQSKGRGLAGIAEGAAVGTRAYASGIERLRTAQEKIDDARDNLETLRRNEDTMTSKERRAIKNDIENTTLSAKKDALAGLQQAYGIDKQDARTFFTTAEAANQKRLDRASSEKIAAMPSAQMQVLSALGGGNVEQGLRLMTEIQAGKKTMAQAYEAYVTAMAGKDTTLTPALTPQQFVAQMKTITMLEKGVPGAIDGTADRK
jgi:hypothetical protein